MATPMDEQGLESASSSESLTNSTQHSLQSQSTNNNNNGSLYHHTSSSAAAHLIRTLDSAFASMNQNAVAAARDAEKARQNARTASELARLYQNFSSIPKPSSSSSTAAATITRYWPPLHQQQQENGEHRYPSTPASGNAYMNSNGTYNTKTTPTTTYTQYTPASTTQKSTTTSKVRGNLSPAEDILSLSLELERTKQAIAEERAMHEQTKAELEKARKRAEAFENQMEEMQNQQETERERYDNKIQELETDLEAANRRVTAADEDAQEALDLAKTNAESREQVEAWLQQALDEIQTLRAHVAGLQQQQLLHEFGDANNNHHHHHHLVRNTNRPSSSRGGGGGENGNLLETSLESIAEEDTNNRHLATSPARPARALVAAGRQMLQRTQPAMVIVSSPLDANERRIRLKEHLESLSATNFAGDSFLSKKNYQTNKQTTTAASSTSSWNFIGSSGYISKDNEDFEGKCQAIETDRTVVDRPNVPWTR
ncbi:hypothetical protein ACA910_012761 [Epithemia clementina (nom. ined.)]